MFIEKFKKKVVLLVRSYVPCYFGYGVLRNIKDHVFWEIKVESRVAICKNLCSVFILESLVPLESSSRKCRIKTVDCIVLIGNIYLVIVT